MNKLSVTGDDLWQRVLAEGTACGLDVSKFGAPHRSVVDDVAAFLSTPRVTQGKNSAEGGFNGLARRILGRRVSAETSHPTTALPIILFGEPGTGKTTFLYVIDTILRRDFELPDKVTAQMAKANGRTHAVPKRLFGGRELTLLSVRKWAELLHFFEWDTEQHKLDGDALDAFLHNVLAPMRVIFADEVEMTGYAPTIPELAAHGILVVGTSNQTTFRQLESARLQPRLYEFGGGDMRSGDPDDAVVRADSAHNALFDKLLAAEAREYETLSYRTATSQDVVLMGVDFGTAVLAPLLESQWMALLERGWRDADGTTGPLGPTSAMVLLLDNFSLDAVRTNFNAVMRFVFLFDAVEQLGIGVKVRHLGKPVALSREAMDHMRVTMYTTQGVSEDIKRKALAGIDRATSRIGQAGAKAERLLAYTPSLRDNS